MASGSREAFFLREATLTLYPAAADGRSVTGSAVFWGALANNLKLTKMLEGVKLAASGDDYRTEFQVDEDHAIEVGKTWIFLKQAMLEFSLPRNQQYVLQIVWVSKDVWYQRTYYGVTCERGEWASAGTNQFGMGLQFRAQFFTGSGGAVSPGNPVNLGGPNGAKFIPFVPAGEAQCVGFFHEEIFTPGDYLLGQYAWSLAVSAVKAVAISWAPQNTPCVLGLEVNGVQSGFTLTLPTGVPNAETGTITVALNNLTIPAGQLVRWQVLSGPSDGASAPWHCAVMMQFVAAT